MLTKKLVITLSSLISIRQYIKSSFYLHVSFHRLIIRRRKNTFRQVLGKYFWKAIWRKPNVNHEDNQTFTHKSARNILAEYLLKNSCLLIYCWTDWIFDFLLRNFMRVFRDTDFPLLSASANVSLYLSEVGMSWVAERQS